ncbi:DNAJ domain-containing protein [Lindgomyces ingoldianus]|uniref:DNAJ domain-containing protein n=1 Tax=Lindgomyces ingoldianus TaxID=673940 RepID=A0ACB6R5T9_9PLEO|nr:DNAJ domain-containing protein [Lindgomyces ingoldianus]KAF2474609.1 DNAJ domain-containing protein [Lindgomyces ingoldianus]
MKPNGLLALVLCTFAAAAAAWSKEDHEIFRLQDEVVAHEGPNVTFYDLLGVNPSVGQDALNKAYRKKSRELHPDKARSNFINSYALNQKKKNKGSKKPGVHVTKQPSKKEVDAHVKEVTAKYQRLSVIANVLKGPERERYDHFLKNGFPKWKGTGYYYARFRPGLGSVMMGLLVVCGGGMHYFALVMGWKRRREFVERYIRHARKTAWGDDTGIKGIPGVSSPVPEVNTPPVEESPDEMVPRNRRERRMMDKDNRRDKKAQAAKKTRISGISTPMEAELISGPQGAKRRIVAENGKVLVVDSVGNVFLEEETDEGVKQEFLLNPDEEPRPTIYDTLLFKFPKYCYNQSISRILGNKPAINELLLETSEFPENEVSLHSATAPNANGETRKRKSKARGIR